MEYHLEIKTDGDWTPYGGTMSGMRVARRQRLLMKTLFPLWNVRIAKGPGKCGHCGAVKPKDQSCACFDNNCQ